VGRRVLDSGIMLKLAKHFNKPTTAINVMVSRKASRLAVSPEAALILLAKESGIGTAIYQRRLDPTKQAQVRDALPGIFASGRQVAAGSDRGKKASGIKAPVSKKASLKVAIEYLIQDSVLLSRCGDILTGSSNFDRAINQATQVLEDRIRKKANPPKKLTGENLVGYAFNEQLSKSVLRVTSSDADDQRGFTQILRGVVPAFRNTTHHHIVDSITRLWIHRRSLARRR
jgi:hypothetical protein